MNMGSVWEQTCSMLAQDMNYVSYNTWVEGNMFPGMVQDDILFLGVKMDRMITMIQSKYGELIEQRLSEAAGRPMKVMMLSRAELDEKMKTADAEAETEDDDPHLNPKYTFENFIVGNGNRFAHAAALAVAESPADAYNPLFIYGGVGLGKTHLMQAIGHFIRKSDPSKKILYMTSESFTNELIGAIQQKKTYEFRERIRKVDILMVDDIQFIAGRESTQQEFFNTFNVLHNENKQIILTSDKPPKDIQRLEERLCSRFEWGLVADIQRPDIDTRIAILRDKALQEGVNVPDDVIELLASRFDSNIRELEGGLKRLIAHATIEKREISMDLCQSAMKEIFDQQKQKKVTAELIMQTVCDYYSVTMDELTGPTRKREITVPRQMAIFLTREMIGMSLPQIGSLFGGRDHTTVLHSCRAIEANMEKTPSVRRVIEEIKQQVKNAR